MAKQTSNSVSKLGCQLCEEIGRTECMHGCAGCNKKPTYFIYMTYYPTGQSWQANYCRDCITKVFRSFKVANQ